MARITVRLFASARELAGEDRLHLSWVQGLTVGSLRLELTRVLPSLGPLLQRSAIAVNRHYAPDLQVLASEDEVAVIPPVAGG